MKLTHQHGDLKRVENIATLKIKEKNHLLKHLIRNKIY